MERFPYFVPASRQCLCYGSGIVPNLRASWLARAQAPALAAAEALALRRLVGRERPDVVNSHWLVPQGIVAGLRCVRGSAPHLATVHGADVFALEGMPLLRSVRRGAARRFARGSDRVFAVSRHLRDRLAALVDDAGLLPPGKVEVLPMGVDTARFGRVAADDVARVRAGRGLEGDFVLFVGRLTPKKGVEHLVDAAGILASRGAPLDLVVVGDGPLRGELEMRARRHPGARVLFTGSLPREELDALYKACAAVVVPSVVDPFGETEGTPVVALEALAAGRPVVASAVAGLPDVVSDGANGFLVPPGDPAALADRLGRIAGDGAERARLARSAALDGARYDWSRIGDAYVAAFRELGGGGR